MVHCQIGVVKSKLSLSHLVPAVSGRGRKGVSILTMMIIQKYMRFGLPLLFALALLFFIDKYGFTAEIETPTGKRLSGRIIEEHEDKYKMELDLPGGGTAIVVVSKENVDPTKTGPGKGRIESVKGTAKIKRAGMPHFTTARKNMLVHPGDEIQTGHLSKAVLTIETAAVNGLGPNTHVTVDRIEAAPDMKSVKVKIGLPRGKLWSEVGKLKTKDSTFEIETPSAVTGVRGTVFRVDVTEATSESMISVIEGEVAVNSKDVDAPEVVLTKDKAIVVERGKAPRKLNAIELLRHIKEVIEEWVMESEYFSTATALAGIGQIEQIEIDPGIPEQSRQKVYDEIQAGWGKAAEDFYEIDKGLKIFYLDFARFPTALEGGLQALIKSTGTPQWNGPYANEENLRDHYDVPYRYAVKTDPHGQRYAEITTVGYDKKKGTRDDRTTTIREEDARRWEDGKSYH